MSANPFENLYQPIKLYQVTNGWVVEIPENKNPLSGIMKEAMQGVFQVQDEVFDPVLAKAKEQAIEEIEKPLVKKDWHIFKELNEALAFISMTVNPK